jgi:transglutaminase-like putative cysteine protease
MPATPERVKAAMDAIKEGRSYDPGPYYLGEPFEDVIADIIANPVAKKQ